MTSRWIEVGDRVFMRRFRTWAGFRFDQNVGLILGERGAVVVDTRGSQRAAARVIAEMRGVSRAPVTAVVNTHHHWDHTFGNAPFRPAPIWGHANNARYFKERNERRRREVMRLEPRIADELANVKLTPPDRTLVRRATIDLGDRVVRLRHLGRGHTDNDILVEVPDASVVFAGDLMVADTMPGFADAFPVSWSGVLQRLAREISAGMVVPGHGGAIMPDGIRQRRDEMAQLVRLGRALVGGRIGEADAVRRSPFRRFATVTALERIRAELP